MPEEIRRLCVAGKFSQSPLRMLYQTDFAQLKLFKRGKVRDVYDLEDKLLVIATDRISCFDVVLPTPIPDKGKILTRISLFWFSFLKYPVRNHLISVDLESLPVSIKTQADILKGRFMIVKKCQVIPFECVVRGCLSGSAWKEYQAHRSVCGIKLRKGLTCTDKLPEPLFTPATKAESGHDENISFHRLEKSLGKKLARKLKLTSIGLYSQAYNYAKGKGVVIADTKFEFGIANDELVLVDEVLTPDSSRFWALNSLRPQEPPVNFDKQFVRDYLESLGWDKTPPAPALPQEVVAKTQEKYRNILKLLTGIESY